MLPLFLNPRERVPVDRFWVSTGPSHFCDHKTKLTFKVDLTRCPGKINQNGDHSRVAISSKAEFVAWNRPKLNPIFLREPMKW